MKSFAHEFLIYNIASGTPVITSREKVVKAFGEEKFVDIEIGTNLTTVTGKSLRISCPSEGSSQKNHEWTINGEHLRYDTRINLQNEDQLIIYNLQFFDDGIYTCRVYSQSGFDMMSSGIKILGEYLLLNVFPVVKTNFQILIKKLEKYNNKDLTQ